MKILIDVDALQAEGILSPELADRLRSHAVSTTGSTAINVLLAFGCIAVAAGLLALVPSPATAVLFGAAFIGLGFMARQYHRETWGKLGAILMVAGALILATALGILIEQPLAGSLVAAAIFAGVAWLAESQLLMALTPFALASAIGGSTGYWHACYEISVEEPTLTIILFSLLALGAWILAKDWTGMKQTMAITFARVSVILVNFGFWIGSLWGDAPGRLWRKAAYASWSYEPVSIPSEVFAVLWAVALVAVGAWAARGGRRFLFNTVAVFGAIHLYTQWFERLGATPGTVMMAGVVAIAIGLGLFHYNRSGLALKQG